MNSSAMDLGHAAGALIGGILVTVDGNTRLSMTGALLIGAAVLVSQCAHHLLQRAAGEQPACN